jgi:uncharacterized protein
MLRPVPEKIDAKQFARSNRKLTGTFKITEFTRLLDVIESAGEPVEFEVEFRRSDQALIVVEGCVSTVVQLKCQRCMEVFDFEMKNRFMLAAIKDESEAEKLPDTFEPLLLDEDGLFEVRNMVEDELILALPIVSMHPEEDCQVKFDSGPESVGEKTEKDNPFDILKSLKNSSN